MLKRRYDFIDLPVVCGDSLVGIAYLLADHFFTDRPGKRVPITEALFDRRIVG